MTAPFTDQGEAAVCARVALALVRLQWHRRRSEGLHKQTYIWLATDAIRGLQLRTVRLALLSLNVWLLSGRDTQAWLAGVLMRDYYRFPIRRCYYAEYKETRRR